MGIISAPRTSMKSWAIVATILGAATVGSAVPFVAEPAARAGPEFLGAAGLLGLVIAGSAALHRQSGLWALSPVAVALSSYVAIAVLSPLLAQFTSNAAGVSAPIQLTAHETFDTFTIFMVASLGLIAGALIGARHAPPVPRGAGLTGSPRIVRLAAITAMLPALLNLVVYRETLLDRFTYLVGDQGSPLTIGIQVLTLPAVVILGWLTRSARGHAGKFFAWIGIVIYTVILFSLGTRAFSLIPPLVVIGILSANPASRPARAALLVAAITSIMLLQATVGLRTSTSENGLLPYLCSLVNGTSNVGLASAANN
ncbi:MAG TPA: hypothetical protein VHW91_09045, partial [Candidatus Dormibacteraeota bacterium]|nr:hypothetical protein [Candidatus Dormibacteraeota bacterium]